MRQALGLLLALLPLLPACGFQYFEDPEDFSCKHSPWSWVDDPVANVLHAQEEDGTFKFNPKGDLVTSRQGTYDFETGDFSWADSYVDNYYIKESRTTGYGTIYANGDLDVLYKIVDVDYLDEQSAQQIRLEREGCEGSYVKNQTSFEAEIDASPPPWADQTFGTYEIVSDKQVDIYTESYDDTDAAMMRQQIKFTPEIKSEVSWDYADGGWVGVRWDYYDGTGWSDWVQWGAVLGSDYDLDGMNEFYFDGSYLQAYDAYRVGTTNLRYSVSIHYLYDGSATGTYWTPGGLTCDITMQPGGERCRMECSDGSSSRC